VYKFHKFIAFGARQASHWRASTPKNRQEKEMRHVTFAGAALATLVFAAAVSMAHADSNYGPVRNGNMCWKATGGNALGYWQKCEAPAQAANARVSRKTIKNNR
jgi:hypothetical protein